MGKKKEKLTEFDEWDKIIQEKTDKDKPSNDGWSGMVSVGSYVSSIGW